MTFHAMPTRYKGILFRSRLEAKYACMFDQLGWRWDYEPVEFKGWIPDFVIHGVKPIYVEVKPVWSLDDAKEVCAEMERALSLEMVDEGEGWHSYPPHEALICGATLPETSFGGDLGIGWLWEEHWSGAYVFELLNDDGRRNTGMYGLCHDCNSYYDRISGYKSGDHHIGEAADLRTAWANATNTVQWRAPIEAR